MELTNEQVQAVRDGQPVPVVPPEVGEACVLVRKDVYEQVQRSASGDDLPSSLAISRMMAEATDDEGLEYYQQYKR